MVTNENVAWPPKLDGVVPREVVSIVSLDDVGSPLIETKNQPGESGSTVNPMWNPVDLTGNPYDTLPQVPDPELTIDEIQELLHSEIFEVTDESAAASSEVTSKVESESAVVELDSDKEASDSDDVDSNLSSLWTTEAGGSDLSTEAEMDALTDVISLPVYTGPNELLPELSTDEPDDTTDEVTHEHAAHPSAGFEKHSHDYRPRLLDDAKSRVGDTTADDEADSMSDFLEPDDGELLSLDTVISPSDSDGVDRDTARESGEPSTNLRSGKARFRDLFTRLRNMKNRSA